MADDDNPADARVEWLRSKIVVSLAKENDKKFDKAFYAEETLAKFVEFFDHEDKLVLVVNDNLKVDNEPPTKLTKGKHSKSKVAKGQGKGKDVGKATEGVQGPVAPAARRNP